jgi:hypothetical protein
MGFRRLLIPSRVPEKYIMYIYTHTHTHTYIYSTLRTTLDSIQGTGVGKLDKRFNQKET